MYDIVRIIVVQNTRRTQHEKNVSAQEMFPSFYMVSMSRNCCCGGLFPVIFYLVLGGGRSAKVHFLVNVKNSVPSK